MNQSGDIGDADEESRCRPNEIFITNSKFHFNFVAFNKSARTYSDNLSYLWFFFS